MCNLYSLATGQEAITRFTRAMRYARNLEPRPSIYPDQFAPIVYNREDGERELTLARWGMPSPEQSILDEARKRADKLEAAGKAVDFDKLLRRQPDSGTTNIRNTASRHWARWLGREHRCVVPFTSFSEYNKEAGGEVWFALDESRPLAFFAGIWVPTWTSVRKLQEGETNNDLYGFLTTEPNAEVGRIHPQAMPVILRTEEEADRWMTAETPDALKLQRPLPDGTLRIVATGTKADSSLPTAAARTNLPR